MRLFGSAARNGGPRNLHDVERSNGADQVRSLLDISIARGTWVVSSRPALTIEERCTTYVRGTLAARCARWSLIFVVHSAPLELGRGRARRGVQRVTFTTSSRSEISNPPQSNPRAWFWFYHPYMNPDISIRLHADSRPPLKPRQKSVIQVNRTYNYNTSKRAHTGVTSDQTRGLPRKFGAAP